MRKIITLSVSLMLTVAAFAETYSPDEAPEAAFYSLTYKGFPYKKTRCENPTYEAGTRLTLPAVRPIKNGQPLKFWFYDGHYYTPSEQFTMPAKNVELVPVWSDGGFGVENTEAVTNAHKIVRDGQLIIMRGQDMYSVLGTRIK